MVSNAKSSLLTHLQSPQYLGCLKHKNKVSEYSVGIYILINNFFLQVLSNYIHPTGNKMLNKSSPLNTMHRLQEQSYISQTIFFISGWQRTFMPQV